LVAYIIVQKALFKVKYKIQPATQSPSPPK